MQSPKVGRIVLFKFNGADPHEVPAIITRVWSETGVNLKVFRDADGDQWVTSVPRSDVAGGGVQWRWPDITSPMPQPHVVT